MLLIFDKDFTSEYEAAQSTPMLPYLIEEMLSVLDSTERGYENPLVLNSSLINTRHVSTVTLNGTQYRCVWNPNTIQHVALVTELNSVKNLNLIPDYCESIGSLIFPQNSITLYKPEFLPLRPSKRWLVTIHETKNTLVVMDDGVICLK